MRRPVPLPPRRLALTSLIDVAFLVLIFFMALPLKRLDAKLSAHLPRDRGRITSETEPRDVVRIRILQRAEATLFRLGDRTFRAPAELEPTLRALGPDNSYEIHASPAVAWNDIVRVVDLLKKLEYTHVQFHGARFPAPGVRHERKLPEPN